MSSSIGKKPPAAQCEPDRSYLRADLLENRTSMSQMHTLTVCSDGQAIDVFSIGAARAGLGKQKWGDGKTPIGTFELGQPRPSSSNYGMFIPIEWRDAHGRRTPIGGAPVGIHGPKVRFDGVGDLDWTEGCLSTATRADNAELSKLIGDRDIRVLEIHVVSRSPGETKTGD